MKTVIDSNAFIKCKKAMMILLIFVFSAGQYCVGQNSPAKTQKNAGLATLPEVNTKLDNIEQSIKSFREDIEIIKNALPDTLAIRNLVSQSSKSIEELKASVEQLKTSFSSKDGENAKVTQTQLKTNSPDQSISFADQPIIMGLPLWLTVTFIGAILIVIVLLLIRLIFFAESTHTKTEDPSAIRLIKEISGHVKDLVERQKKAENFILDVKNSTQDLKIFAQDFKPTISKLLNDNLIAYEKKNGSLMNSIDSLSNTVNETNKVLDNNWTWLSESFNKLNNWLFGKDKNLDASIERNIDLYYAPGKIEAIDTLLTRHGLTTINSGNVIINDPNTFSNASAEQPSNAVLIPNLIPISIHLVKYLEKMDAKLKDYTELETKNNEYEEKYKIVIAEIEVLCNKINSLNKLNEDLPDFIKAKEELTAEKAQALLQLAEAREQLKSIEESKSKLKSELETAISKTEDLTSQKSNMETKVEVLEKDFKVTKEENTRLNELKRIMPNHEEGLDFFGKLFGNDWKQDILLSFLLLQSEAKNKSDTIRATFSRLDDAIYDTYSDNPERLKAVRQVMQKKLNEGILDGKYQIQWPLAGDELNERIHSAETLSGNRIKTARTAIVKDANGTLITKSKVITEV